MDFGCKNAIDCVEDDESVRSLHLKEERRKAAFSVDCDGKTWWNSSRWSRGGVAATKVHDDVFRCDQRQSQSCFCPIRFGGGRSSQLAVFNLRTKVQSA